MFAVNGNRIGPYPKGQTLAEIKAAELASTGDVDAGGLGTCGNVDVTTGADSFPLNADMAPHE